MTAATDPHDGGPTPAQLKTLRALHGLTQAGLAERLAVTERQVQRWEAGEGSLSGAYWQLLRQTLGVRTARDFEPTHQPMSQGWNPDRDAKRETIERGDVVELQAFDGPLLWATVCASYLGDAMGYEAIVTEFAGVGDVGDEHRGFCLGERVRFDRKNVIHLEQRAPRAAARPTGG